ncbi:hypothetical protein AAMO2058_000127800 [Amorphochlora amoebiformis]
MSLSSYKRDTLTTVRTVGSINTRGSLGSFLSGDLMFSVDIKDYEIGDKVSYFSSSAQRWFNDGVVIEISHRGLIKVGFNRQKDRTLASKSKWIGKEDAALVKRRLVDDICTDKTVSEVIKKQIDFLTSHIHTKKKAIEKLAGEIMKAKEMKTLLASELSKLEGTERLVEDLKAMEGMHLEELIQHKEIKRLKSSDKADTSVARIAESMIFALRWSLMRNPEAIDKLSSSDFSQVVEASFPSSGSGAPMYTPAHRLGDFNWKDYSPKVFKKIRQEFSGVSELQYLEMIAANQKFLEFISNSRSGAFFFYSANGRFMIKTISKAECDFMRQSLKKYYHHLKKNRKSLVAKVYGLHRVKIGGMSLKFLIMESIFYSEAPRYIHTIFDLKGSRGVTRMATAKDFSRAPTENFTSTVLKDNDFVDRKGEIRLGKEKSEELKKQLTADIHFLQKLKVIDYSLLVGMHFVGKPVPEDGKPYTLRPDGVEYKKHCAQKPPSMANASPSSSALPLSPVATTKNISPEASDIFDDSKSVSLAPPDDSKSVFSSTSSIGIDASSNLSEEELPGVRGVFHSEDNKTIYYLGVIDMLIQYGVKKKMENMFKTSIQGKSESNVSVIPPDRYAKRFLQFVLPRIL